MTPAELALAEQLAVQMSQALADYLAKKAAGTLTMADVQDAADKAGTDLAQLQKDIDEAK